MTWKVRFYKANLHCHTTVSDGQKTPEEVKKIYTDMGYSVVAFTDHDVFIPHDELSDDKFLVLHGFEMEINGRDVNQRKNCHLCFIALNQDNLMQPCYHRSKYMIGNGENYRQQIKFDETEKDFEREYTPQCVNEIISTAKNMGFFVTYNHPSWSLENYSDYSKYSGMNAMEMFNGSCITMGYEDYNMVSVLHKLLPIFSEIGEKDYAEYCDKTVNELKELIDKYGIVETKEFGKIYVSETDCLGRYHYDDDANIPSLLSIPYLEYPFIDEEAYKNTRKLILSKNNKYYYEGKELHGIGSPHTPEGRVWPLAIAMQGITATDENEIIDCFNMLVNSTANTGYMHEGVDADDTSKYSRSWFAWANSLFSEFVIRKKDIIIKKLK